MKTFFLAAAFLWRGPPSSTLFPLQRVFVCLCGEQQAEMDVILLNASGEKDFHVLVPDFPLTQKYLPFIHLSKQRLARYLSKNLLLLKSIFKGIQMSYVCFFLYSAGLMLLAWTPTALVLLFFLALALARRSTLQKSEWICLKISRCFGTWIIFWRKKIYISPSQSLLTWPKSRKILILLTKHILLKRRCNIF